MLSIFRTAVLFSIVSIGRSIAHEHHGDNLPKGEGISPDPIVSFVLRLKNQDDS